MNAEFNTSRLVATIGLSSFVFGIAMGPAWSPLAEFYGRRPIYLASFAGFFIWIIPSAVAKNIETMIIARFFQGLAGSAFLSVSGGTVGDLFKRDEMLAPMAIFALAPFGMLNLDCLCPFLAVWRAKWLSRQRVFPRTTQKGNHVANTVAVVCQIRTVYTPFWPQLPRQRFCSRTAPGPPRRQECHN